MEAALTQIVTERNRARKRLHSYKKAYQGAKPASRERKRVRGRLRFGGWGGPIAWIRADNEGADLGTHDDRRDEALSRPDTS